RSLAVPPVGADPEDLLAHDPRVDVPDTLPDAAPPTGLADLELGVAQAHPGRVLDVPPGDLDADDVRRLARLEPGEVGVQPRLRPDVLDGRRSHDRSPSNESQGLEGDQGPRPLEVPSDLSRSGTSGTTSAPHRAPGATRSRP